MAKWLKIKNIKLALQPAAKQEKGVNMAEFILSAFSDEIDPDLEIQMDVLSQHAINYIEIRGVNGRNIIEHSLKEVKEVKKRFDDRGFKISAIGSPIGKIGIRDDFAPHLDRFKHVLETAVILEAPSIRVFSFYIPEDADKAGSRAEVMRRLRSFVEASEGSGVNLLHENEKGIYGDTAERCLDIMRTVDSANMSLVFDPANFIHCGETTYPDAYKMLEKYIVYMHVKDARFHDRRTVPAGAGDGRIGEILLEIDKSREGRFFLSLEPHLGNLDGLPELEPDSPGFGLEEGGPMKFALAAQELKKTVEAVKTGKAAESR